MDNQSPGAHQFELPSQPVQQTGEFALPHLPSRADMLPPTGVTPAGTPPPIQPPVPQPYTPPQMGQVPLPQPPVTTAPVLPSSAQLQAEDSDLIEKEWVDKAKEIVARTKYDPYAQNREITRMKADYMHKRYNKIIKIPEE